MKTPFDNAKNAYWQPVHQVANKIDRDPETSRKLKNLVEKLKLYSTSGMMKIIPEYELYKFLEGYEPYKLREREEE